MDSRAALPGSDVNVAARGQQTPSTLRAMAVGLGKAGDAHCVNGDLGAALVSYRESLDMFRQLRSMLGDTPQVLRDLSVGLNKIACTERGIGNLSVALSNYHESLNLLRQVRSMLGDTPQALRDLSLALARLADVERDSGNSAAAIPHALEIEKISELLGNLKA